MKPRSLFFKLKTLPLLIATLFLDPGAFAQTEVGMSTEAPMGILKGRIVDDRTREPLADIKVRLIGFNGETLTNSLGEFFLEAPGSRYSGLVMELPEGQLKLFEQAIVLNPGQFLNIDQVPLKAFVEKEPLELPTPEDLQNNPRKNPMSMEKVGQNPQLIAMNELAVADQVRETVAPIAESGRSELDPTLQATEDFATTPQPHPSLMQAREMVAAGNFFAANRAYEEYLALFPEGPVAVEYGVMVYYNIQNAEGRSILKQALELPGLRPIDIDTITRLLMATPVVVIERPDRYESHARIRLRHRHRACH
jgi:hypothetical protein